MKTNSDMDINQARCANYERAQARHCKCMPKDAAPKAIEDAVIVLYEKAGKKDDVRE